MTQKFDIFIISLHGASDRQKSVVGQLDELNLNYNIRLFNRTTTLNIPEYNQKKRLANFGYDMLPGEIGCFLSHRKIWKQTAKGDKPTLILEDDFMISDPSIEDHINKIIESPLKFNIIRLQGINKKKHTSINTSLELNLVTFSGNPAGSTAYLITPQASNTLLSKTTEFFIPIDDFIDNEWRHGITIYGLLPYPVQTISAESEIGPRNKPNFSFLTKVRIETIKTINSIRRMTHSLIKTNKH